MDVFQEPGTRFEFDTYDDVRHGFFDPDLSRTFDRRPFEAGNVRHGVVSTAHGELHRARRRLENRQFRAEALRSDEVELAPRVIDEWLDTLLDREAVDLSRVAHLLNAAVSARRFGIDLDRPSLEELTLLDAELDGLAQMSGIIDSKDPERTREIARTALADFERDFVRAARERRAGLIAQRGTEIEQPPDDLLTMLLLHRHDPGLELDDDGLIVRELATYFVGGTSTTAPTLVNATDFLFLSADRDPSVRSRIVDDLAFAQRFVHETLRLRPLTPKPKRYAEADTSVGGRAIPRGSVVVLDIARANVDPRVFGPTANDFDPDREVPHGVFRWGLSFGAGAHQCPGRSLAGGFPLSGDRTITDDHLFGLIAVMFREIVRRGVRRDPERAPERDTRRDTPTERFSRWLSYPVLVDAPSRP
jgi:cytochrome P450